MPRGPERYPYAVAIVLAICITVLVALHDSPPTAMLLALAGSIGAGAGVSTPSGAKSP